MLSRGKHELNTCLWPPSLLIVYLLKRWLSRGQGFTPIFGWFYFYTVFRPRPSGVAQEQEFVNFLNFVWATLAFLVCIVFVLFCWCSGCLFLSFVIFRSFSSFSFQCLATIERHVAVPGLVITLSAGEVISFAERATRSLPF